MVRAIRWIVTASCAAAALLLLTVAGAHLALSTEEGARRLSGMINSLYPGEITGSTIEVSLLRQRVTVRDVVLLGADHKTIVRADRASLTINLLALLRQDVILETIEVVRPFIVLELLADGRLNIEAAFVEDTPEESPYNVYIRKLTCTGGTFVYQGASGDPVVALEDLDLSMDSAFEHDTLLHVASPSTRIFLFASGRKIDLGRGSASCTIFNDRISDIRAQTARGSSRAVLKGSITDMSKTAQLGLDLALEGDMADLADILALGDQTNGVVQARITATRDYDDPDLAFDIEYGGGTMRGLAVGRARMKGSITRRVATISDLSGEFASGRVAASGTVDLRRLFPDGYFEGIKEDDVIGYGLSVTGTSLLLDDIPGIPGWLTGRLSAEAELEGTGLAPETMHLGVAFRAWGRSVSAGTFLHREDLALDGRLSFSDRVLSTSGLTLKTGWATATVAGSLRPEARAVNGTLALDAPLAEPLLARVGLDGGGSLSATARVTGAWDSPSMDITAGARQARLEGITLGDIHLRALLAGDSLTVTSCSLKNRDSVANASGDIRLFRRFPDIHPDPHMDLTLELSGVVPGDFTEELPVAGTVDGRISVSGSLSTLLADIRLEGRGLAYRDYRVGDATLKGGVENGVLTVTDLEVRNRSSVLHLGGDIAVYDPVRMRIDRDPAFHLGIQGTDLLIGDFTDRASGTFTVQADLSGTLRRPAGNATLTAGEVDLGFQHIPSLQVQARSDGDIVWFDPVIVTFAPEENINGRGSLTMGGMYEFSLGTPGIRMEHLDLIRRYDSARGMIFLHATGQGSLDNPTVSGRIAAADITFLDKPLDDMTLAFDLRDRTLQVEGNWIFRFSGRHDLASGDITATALFAETELDPLFTLTGRTTLSGRLTGRVDARGNARALEDMDVVAEISSVDIFHDGSIMVTARNAGGFYRDGILTIPPTRLAFGRSGWFDVQGRGDVKRALTLSADGVIPMEVMGLFMEDLADSSGLMRVSSQIRTRELKPEITALITLEDIAYTLPMNGQRLHSLNGTVSIRGDEVSIEDITGRLDTGAFRMGGTARLEGFDLGTLELLAETKALPVSIPDTMEFTMDAELSLDMRGNRSRLWADVVILDGVYYRDMQVNLLTGVIDRLFLSQKRFGQKKAAKPELSPALRALELDVTVKRRGDVKVENNIAVLDLNPDLKITGTLQKPVVNGRVAVTDGIVTFQNNDFTVTKGVIDFLDPYRTRAEVDIRATTRVRDWDITLDLEGEPDNLQLTLSSEPAEEPADILSLLIVGKTSRELTLESSSVTVSPSGMMAELLTSTYGEEIKKATTLDILEFRGSDFSTAGGGESMRLTVGKELSRRMTVKYEMETRNTETIQRAIAEYKILENLLINGYQGTDGSFGTDMIYRYEFR